MISGFRQMRQWHKAEKSPLRSHIFLFLGVALNLAGLEKGMDKIKVDEFFSIPSDVC